MSVKIALPPRNSHTHPSLQIPPPFKKKDGLKRADYIEPFFKNINWKIVKGRMK
jgi:hypothetical protein